LIVRDTLCLDVRATALCSVNPHTERGYMNHLCRVL